MYNSIGSVLLAMVLHAMANTADVIVPLSPDRIVVYATYKVVLLMTAYMTV